MRCGGRSRRKQVIVASAVAGQFSQLAATRAFVNNGCPAAQPLPNFIFSLRNLILSRLPGAAAKLAWRQQAGALQLLPGRRASPPPAASGWRVIGIGRAPSYPTVCRRDAPQLAPATLLTALLLLCLPPSPDAWHLVGVLGSSPWHPRWPHSTPFIKCRLGACGRSVLGALSLLLGARVVGLALPRLAPPCLLSPLLLHTHQGGGGRQ